MTHSGNVCEDLERMQSENSVRCVRVKKLAHRKEKQ